MSRKKITDYTWPEIKQQGWESKTWIPDKNGRRRKVDNPNRGEFRYRGQKSLSLDQMKNETAKINAPWSS